MGGEKGGGGGGAGAGKTNNVNVSNNKSFMKLI